MRRLGLRSLYLAAPAALLLPIVPALANETTIYVYDALGRLVEVRKSGTVNDGVETSIAYDAAGNRTDYDVTGSNGSGSDGGVTGGVGSDPNNGSGGGGSGGGGNDDPPTETPPSFSVDSTGMVEGQPAVFTITKTGSVQNSYSVNWYTSNGSALAGSDYGGASGTLTFAANETSKQISMTTIDDNAVEALETFYINLNGTSGGAGITDPQGAAQITDNDAPANGVPVAANDATTLCQFGFVQPLLNDTDPDGDTLTITSANVTSGSMSINILGTTISIGAISGNGTIVYTVSDTVGQTDTATISVVKDCSNGGNPLF